MLPAYSVSKPVGPQMLQKAFPGPRGSVEWCRYTPSLEISKAQIGAMPGPR